VNMLVSGFVFLPLEKLFPQRRGQTLFRPEWNEDLFYYLVSSLLVQVVTFLTLAPSTWVKGHVPMAEVTSYIGGQPFLVQLVLVMLLTDLVQYWVHYAFHRVPFLWRFHAVHHSAETMDWLAAGRMHILEVVALRSLTAVPMLCLGFDPGVVQGYVLLVYFTSAFIHANVSWKFGALERFVVTPRFHHWHHAIEHEAIDVNFAIHFPLYDWLFGTFYMPGEAWPKGYGVCSEPVPKGYVAQFLYPFRWLRQRLKGTPAAAE
jgi:sterol desaturase/sphingolipid hydroxylase (fatty acid hydroxylase superfamily)